MRGKSGDNPLPACDDALLNSCRLFFERYSQGFPKEQLSPIIRTIITLYTTRWEKGEDLPDIREYLPQWGLSDLVFMDQVTSFFSDLQAVLEKRMSKRLKKIMPGGFSNG